MTNDQINMHNVKIKRSLQLLVQWSIIGLSFTAVCAHADIYKSVDKNGNVMYTNYHITGSTRLGLKESVYDNSAHHTHGVEHVAEPNSTTHINPSTQLKRDQLRVSVIESELQTEQQALNDAIDARQHATPLLGEHINSPAYLQHLAKLDEMVNLHRDNVNALNKELTKLKPRNGS